jgi:hypothetical protein
VGGLALSRTRKHPNCLACNRPFRMEKETAAERPGTVQYTRAGLCSGCARRKERTGNPAPVQSPGNGSCSHCERPMRPKRATPTQRPGTVLYGAQGLCTTCYVYKHQHGTLDGYMPPKTVRKYVKEAAVKAVPNVDPALEAMMRKRAERKARQHRLAQIRRPAA